MQPKATTSRTWPIVLGLVLLTFVIYAPVIWFDFVEIDDFGYVYENPRITAGLKLQNILWFWTHGLGGNWHPLTAFSHMLDCQLFGLNARWHHVENVLFHAANVVLVFFFIRRFGDEKQTLVPAWITAALFAVHPLHVESVAWVAERKDVLSAFFFLLALHAYFNYAKETNKRAYWLCFLWFVMGVLSKPMVVTLPCVLLLLDFWPLQRSDWKMLLVEKWPFFAVSALDSVFTFMTQHSAGAMSDLTRLTWTGKLAYIANGYRFYVEKFFAPSNLAIFYPVPHNPSLIVAIILLFVVLAISVVAILLKRRHPSLITGWFWFIGMLVPVIGLVQVGSQAYADRYSYLPSIGLSILVIWPIAKFITSRTRAISTVTIATCALAVLISICQSQLLFWQNTEILYTRALNVVPNNREALVHYGGHCEEIGLLDKAAVCYTNALVVEPEGYTLFHLGKIYVRKKDLNAAQRCFETALKYSPDRPEVNHALGRLFSDRDQPQQALYYFARSVAGHDDYVDGLRDFAWIVAIDPKISATNAPLAIQYAQQLNTLEPNNAVNLAVLAGAQARTGKFAEAIQTEEKAIQLAESSGNSRVATRCRKHLSEFQKGQMAKD